MRIHKLFTYTCLLWMLFTNICAAQDLEQKFQQLMFGKHSAQSNGKLWGHSHNDYKQDIPFLRSYYAGMQSIEADIFLRDGVLYVAHEEREIQKDRTLDALYLRPLYERFQTNNGYPFADTTKQLQIVVDIKENYPIVIPALLEALKPYSKMIAKSLAAPGVHIVLSGDIPSPKDFAKYPTYISFDGRPTTTYSQEELKRVAMISASMTDFTHWNGKGRLKEAERQAMHKLIATAKQQGKPFRFWATPDSKNAWIELEKLGVSWINTDTPDDLSNWFKQIPYSRFSLPTPLAVYKPTYTADGSDKKPKNIILLIGDGMGVAHVKAALSANHGALNMSQMRNIGFSRTEAADAGNTDSGAGGSAIATGQHGNNGSISVDTLNRPLPRLSDLLAEHAGMQIAIISTGDITDATPAVFYASHKNRNASEDIAKQLFKSRATWVAGAQPGFFKDTQKQENYIQEADKTQWTVTTDTSNFQLIGKKRLATLLPSDTFKPVKDGRGPILQSLVRTGTKQLHNAPSGFFMMAEGAQIDWGGHARDLPYIVTETLDFDQAVGEALRFADQDGQTLVIVTADHETGGLTLLDVNESKGYIAGDFSSNDHTNIMVPVFAYGPGSKQFSGIYENIELFHKILKIMNSSKR